MRFGGTCFLTPHVPEDFKLFLAVSTTGSIFFLKVGSNALALGGEA